MTDSNIFLFVPNIIGYCRILFAFVSFYYMPTDYYKAFFFYGASSLMDAVDGYAARHFNQGTRFGAMLDMLMDRCGTMCLIMVLGHFYPNWMVIFQLSNALDIASHWLHMHVHDVTGGKSHKTVDENTNPVLKLYYTSRQFLFIMCAGNELFYALLYLNHFTYGPLRLWQILSFLTFPIALVKSVISLVHLISASKAIGAIDVDERRKKLEK